MIKIFLNLFYNIFEISFDVSLKIISFAFSILYKFIIALFQALKRCFKSSKINKMQYISPSESMEKELTNCYPEFRKIKKENDKIDKYNAQIEEEIKLELEIEKNKKIINKFKELKENIDSITSQEILEILAKVNELKLYYESIPANKRDLSNIFNIEDFIKNKIKSKLENKLLYICKLKEKEDMIKSFIDELKYCQSRFPEYEDILEVQIIKAENLL